MADIKIYGTLKNVTNEPIANAEQIKDNTLNKYQSAINTDIFDRLNTLGDVPIPKVVELTEYIDTEKQMPVSNLYTYNGLPASHMRAIQDQYNYWLLFCVEHIDGIENLGTLYLVFSTDTKSHPTYATFEESYDVDTVPDWVLKAFNELDNQVQSNWEETDTTSKAYIQNKPSIPTKTSQLTNDSDFLTTQNISGKQDTLVSGTNIKTVDGKSILGSGNLSIDRVVRIYQDPDRVGIEYEKANGGIGYVATYQGLANEIAPYYPYAKEVNWDDRGIYYNIGTNVDRIYQNPAMYLPQKEYVIDFETLAGKLSSYLGVEEESPIVAIQYDGTIYEYKNEPLYIGIYPPSSPSSTPTTFWLYVRKGSDLDEKLKSIVSKWRNTSLNNIDENGGVADSDFADAGLKLGALADYPSYYNSTWVKSIDDGPGNSDYTEYCNVYYLGIVANGPSLLGLYYNDTLIWQNSQSGYGVTPDPITKVTVNGSQLTGTDGVLNLGNVVKSITYNGSSLSVGSNGNVSIVGVNQVLMNGSYKYPSNGILNLGTVLTSTTSSVISGSNTPITSGGVYTALQNYETKLAFTTTSSTSYTATRNIYHRHTNTPSSLSISLPTSSLVAGDTCAFNFTTASDFSSFTISGSTVKKMKGFSIEAGKTYEVVALYDGAKWLITATEFE